MVGLVFGISFEFRIAQSCRPFLSCFSLQTLHGGFGDLGELSVLSVFQNRFTGSIPTQLGGGKGQDLKRLLLHHNEFVGTLPTQLGRLDKLEWLALNHNQLAGTVPEEVLLGESLKILDLQSNDFEGALPASLASMTNLGTLCQRGPLSDTNILFLIVLFPIRILSALCFGTSWYRKRTYPR